MKNVKSQLLSRLCVLVISLFPLGLATSYAQIGDLGIYGGVPNASRSSIRFARLDEYPAVEPGLNHILPINGYGNFNFLYTPDGMGFLPGGGYKITYLGANQTTSYGYDIVTYSPNSGHTNGVEVRAFYSPPSTPRGVHGNVYGRINNVNYPFPNAYVTASALHQTLQVNARTNANGYFSFYYTNEASPRFLPVDPVFFHEHYYQFIITGTLNGCSFARIVEDPNALWVPSNTTDPSSSSYFVNLAEEDRGDIIITPSNCSGD